MNRDSIKRAAGVIFVWLAVAGLAFGLGSSSQAAGKKEKRLKLGTSCSVAKRGAVYKSSNQKIAYVNKEGIVTGKKQGKATIQIKKGNKISKKRVVVVANGKKKKPIDSCTGEIGIARNRIAYYLKDAGENKGTEGEESSGKTSKYQYSATIKVKNNGKRDAKNVKIMAEIAGKNVLFSFGKVKAGKTETVTVAGETVDSQVPELAEENLWDEPVDMFAGKVSLKKIRVYSNEVYTCYDYQKKKTSIHWATADTTPPEILGFVKGNSYNQNMPYQVIYSDDKDYDYFKYVWAEDDREGKVLLTVNTEKVNFKKAGIYKITYTAQDRAGNVGKANAKIEIRKKKQVDELADEVLSEIIKKKWSEKRKAIAIYDYTREHISYVGTSNKKSWEKEAVHGIRYGEGDCYTYYAVARVLLTRAGIPNIEVVRYRGEGHHWWNMIYVAGGWYHYDCGPRKGGGRFCMLTDAQLTEYSKTHGNKYIWNYKKLPKTPKKKLTTIF